MMATSRVHPARPTPEAAEIRYSRGAWLTLALAALALVFPLAGMLIGSRAPADGWSHTTDPNGRYRLDLDLTGQPSPLREGDTLLAIDGQPVTYGYRTPLPPDLQAGQTLRYTVLRDGETLDVDAPVLDRPAAMVARYIVRQTQRDPFVLILPLLTWPIVGFAFVRRPGNHAARLLLVIFSYFAGANWFGLANWEPFVYAYPAPLAFAMLVYLSAWAWLFFPALTHLALVFPVRLGLTRRFPRLLPALLYGLPLLVTLLSVLLALAGRPEGTTLLSMAVITSVGIFIVTVCASLIHNFRVTREPVARSQLRWVALGLGLGWGGGVFALFLAFAMPSLQPVADGLFAGLTLLFPLSLVIAITRYRLFDIDIIINRALVYGSLTGLLLAVYLGSVVLLQAGFRAVTGQTSELAIIISTLAIAALFQPLRHWLQGVIDRRFYRRKYHAARTLAAFSVHLRDEVDLPTLQQELVDVVRETMQPSHLSLWVRPAYVSPWPDRQPDDA